MTAYVLSSRTKTEEQILTTRSLNRKNRDDNVKLKLQERACYLRCKVAKNGEHKRKKYHLNCDNTERKLGMVFCINL